jgi:2-succinyl-5-enolpyruvyl-6-hydroxy-3-cyclohexene-1-carboxylate synthase
VFIVINNRGGGIFNYLAQKNLDCFEKAWVCEQDMDFSTIAQLYQLHFTTIQKLSDFSNVLEKCLTTNGIYLIEILIDQKISVENHHILFNEIKNVLE